jgi:hypothetical protein
MAASTPLPVVASAVSLCLLASGCMSMGDTTEKDAKVPGESLGFFAVDGKLTDDNCGAESLNAPNDWSFQVKLSRQGSALYWLNGREAIVGEIDKAGSFDFETHLDMPLSARHGAAKGCTIVRRDAADGALTNSNASLSAKLSYTYGATSDSDCAEFITGTNGAPEALPCRLTYSLSGDRIAE